MAGFMPAEGRAYLRNLLLARGVLLGLFTNENLDDTASVASLTQPRGLGYAERRLPGDGWQLAGELATYALQTYRAAGPWEGLVRGYYLRTETTLLIVDRDPGGPFEARLGDVYDVLPRLIFQPRLGSA